MQIRLESCKTKLLVVKEKSVFLGFSREKTEKYLVIHIKCLTNLVPRSLLYGKFIGEHVTDNPLNS
jgi:hypothetical protein